MGAAVDPQTICNVTLVGDPAATTRLHRRLRRGRAGTGPIPWAADGVEHTIHLAELSSRAPLADLERSVRVADGVVAVIPAAAPRASRLESLLRMADDHQVARLCLITGLHDPAADFDRCVRVVAGVRGAVPLVLHSPMGTGTDFTGVIDLMTMWSLAPMATEFFGSHRHLAEQRYRDLVAMAFDQVDTASEIPAAGLADRIRHLTHLGEAVPVLCDPAPIVDDIAPLLNGIVGYLPSPLHVCQPEHTLDC